MFLEIGERGMFRINGGFMVLEPSVLDLITGDAPNTPTGGNNYGRGDFAIDFGRDGSFEFGVLTAERSSTLRQGDNMWMYLPSVGKPMRITSLQSVTGGVFNNADIMRLDYAVEYDVKSMEEKGDSYLLDLKAKTGEVAYDKLKMWVAR